MLPLRPLAAALLLALGSQTAWAFDASVFQVLDAQSLPSAQAFIALPDEEKQSIALEHLGNDTDTQAVWQIILLGQLNQHPQEADALKVMLDANENRESLSSDGRMDATEAVAQLCFLQLQQPTATDINAEQQILGDTLQEVCAGTLAPILHEPEVFQWFLHAIQDDKHPAVRTAALTNTGSLDALTPAQNKQMQDVLVPPYFDGDSDDTQGISALLQKAASDTLKEAVFAGIQKQLPTAKPKALPEIFHALLAVNTPASLDSFWENVWKNPKQNLPAARQALSDYVSDAQEERFPQYLHDKVIAQVEDKQDIRLAAVYLSLATPLEGDWQHGVDLISKIEGISATLPKDAETQAVLKYVLLQAAGIEYLNEAKNLRKTQHWLDTAKAINGEPLSWYLHLTDEKDEKRADQWADFQGIQQVYDTGQLPALAAWVEDGTKPAEPFRDLHLRIYSLVTDMTVTDRLWHDPKTGAALLMDDGGQLAYFNGWEIANAESPVKMHPISSDADAGKPTLRSPLEVWFTYLFSALDSDSGNTATMRMDEFTVGEKAADERLLFAKLDDGESAAFPDYIEYVRYGAEIMLNIDARDGIQQYLLVHPTPIQAAQWMAALAKQAPPNTEAHPLWHRTVDEAVMPLPRRYQHPADADKDEITLSPLYADKGFAYVSDELDCTKPLKPEALEQQSAAFSKAEYALYQQGYRMVGIAHDNHCVE
jgi:hypothetical protein